jgi:N-acetyl-alpha-D-muramate 1-phosphate uridylyltransferase
VSLAAVVLAAGAGTRLRPLTLHRPKALCPVDDVPLVDHAIERVRPHVAAGAIAVNVHHGRELLEAHLAGRVHLSVEEPQVLGTAGALGQLRGWIDGRDVLVTNADAWLRDDLAGLVDGWDGERVRLLTVADEARPDFGGTDRYAGACLLPWRAVRDLAPVPSGLYEVCWRDEEAAGQLELIRTTSTFIDCGTPRDYLLANLDASGGASIIGAGAVVEGEVIRSVVWSDGKVAAGERLVEAIRVGADLTVQTAD